MEAKIQKQQRLQKKIMTDKFVGVTYMVMDAMAPGIILSQLFQKDNVDIAIVRVTIDH